MGRELLHQTGAMNLDGARRDAKVIGNRLVRIALCEAIENFALAGRQQGKPHLRIGFFDRFAVGIIDPPKTARDRVDVDFR
jgi:hypothetical protein